MAHAQSSPRGFFAKSRIDVGGSAITGNSTGVTFAGTVAITGAATLASTLSVSGQAVKGLLSANSTALILPNSVRVGSKTTYLTSNSTGVKLGNLYISCNSTGNTTT